VKLARNAPTIKHVRPGAPRLAPFETRESAILTEQSGLNKPKHTKTKGAPSFRVLCGKVGDENAIRAPGAPRLAPFETWESGILTRLSSSSLVSRKSKSYQRQRVPHFSAFFAERWETRMQSGRLPGRLGQPLASFHLSSRAESRDLASSTAHADAQVSRSATTCSASISRQSPRWSAAPICTSVLCNP